MGQFDAMRLFVRVAERGSFTAAAQQAGLARSVVTRQIAALESHLGTKLMTRSTRRLSLTPEGALYLEKCRVILNLVEAAETDIRAESQVLRGAIRISLPLSFGLTRLSPLLLDFSRQHPDVGLDMDYTDRRVKLIDEGFDLSVRITRRLEPGDIARKIGHGRMQAVASPDYLGRHGRPAHPAELANHECLGYTGTASMQNWPFMVGGKPQNFSVRSRINANNGEVLTEAAAQGMGITCQPDFIAAPFLASRRVEEILTGFPIPALGIYAMLPSNRHIPHRVRVLIDFLVERLAEAPSPAAAADGSGTLG